MGFNSGFKGLTYTSIPLEFVDKFGIGLNSGNNKRYIYTETCKCFCLYRERISPSTDNTRAHCYFTLASHVMSDFF